MEIEIWHDEYKGDETTNEYWHGLFFIPTKSKDKLLNALRSIRDEYGLDYTTDIKFAGSLKKEGAGRLIANQLSLVSHSLIVKESEAKTQFYNRDAGQKYRREFKPFLSLNELFGCKFILFKVPDNHEEINEGMSPYSERVETTFRYALRSGLHFLFSEQVTISKFYFDGHEHHGRNIDLNRIIHGEFRDHVLLSDTLSIDDKKMSDRDEDTKMVMCLVDNTVGGMTAKLKESVDKFDTLYPISGIIEREQQGKLNLNKNGRWYKAVSMFQINVVDGEKEIGLHPKIETTNYQH